MKILLCAPQDGATNLYVARGFVENGWDVTNFAYREMAFKQGWRAMNESLAEAGRGHDLVLVLKGETVQPETYRKLRRYGIRTAIWNFDPWQQSKEAWITERAVEADAFFTIAKGLVPWFEKHGAKAKWLLEGADPDIHGPVPPRPGFPVFPISFIGTVAGVDGRDEWLGAIRTAFPDGVHLFGSYPGPHQAWHHGRAEGDRGLCFVVSNTGVNLGRDRCPTVERSYGARLFRTLAAGGYLLTNATEGVKEDFAGGLGVYESNEDCVARIKWALSHPEERARIAQRGREIVLRDHTFAKRCAALAKEVGF